MRVRLRELLLVLLVVSVLAGCAPAAVPAPQVVKETVIVKETVPAVKETVIVRETVVPAAEAAPVTEEEELLTVMNPQGTQPPITLFPLSERPESLDGKTVYIVSVQFPLTRPFFEEMESAMTAKYPETTWVFKEKAGTYFDDDPDLWAEVKEKADAVVMGVGH